jgi:hypothetical protein
MDGSVRRSIGVRLACVTAIALLGVTLSVTAADAGATVTKNVPRQLPAPDPTPADFEGTVNAQGNVKACENGVPVALFKRVNGNWVKKGQANTDNSGFYKVPPGESRGRWRTVALAVTKTSGGKTVNCLRAASPVVSVT